MVYLHDGLEFLKRTFGIEIVAEVGDIFGCGMVGRWQIHFKKVENGFFRHSWIFFDRSDYQPIAQCRFDVRPSDVNGYGTRITIFTDHALYPIASKNRHILLCVFRGPLGKGRPHLLIYHHPQIHVCLKYFFGRWIPQCLVHMVRAYSLPYLRRVLSELQARIARLLRRILG